MTEIDYSVTVHHGPFGHAEQVPDIDIPSTAETVVSWLIDSPYYHPLWTQYMLFVVRLRDDQPGFPQPYHKFEGTTHELITASLNPDYPVSVPRLVEMFIDHETVHWLEPINIHEQFIATDDEMRKMAWIAAWAITQGDLTPETADAPDRIREDWLVSMTKTLAHIRGEEHAP